MPRSSRSGDQVAASSASPTDAETRISGGGGWRGRAGEAPAGAPRAGFALLLTLSMAQFMVVLDFTIVNVALPSIQHGLHVATTTLQWLVSGYAVAFGGFLLLGGRLADVYGRARLYRIGLVVFVVGEHRRGPGRRAWPADRLPGGPGHRGGHAGSRGPVPAGHQLSRPAGAQPRPGHLRRDRLDGICCGRGARRPAGRGHVASGLLRQRPGRGGAADRLVPAAATGSAQQQGAAGRSRRHQRDRRGRPARVRGRTGGRHAEGHPAGPARRGRGRAAGRVRRPGEEGAGPDSRPGPAQGPRHRWEPT